MRRMRSLVLFRTFVALMAVFVAITPLVGEMAAADQGPQCADLNGDGVPDVLDVVTAVSVAFRGDTTLTCPDRPTFTDMGFPESRMFIDLGLGPIEATVSGGLDVDAQGVVNGQVTVLWSGAVAGFAGVTAGDNYLEVLTVGGHTLNLWIDGHDDSCLVDGIPMFIPDVLEGVGYEWETISDPLSWSPLARSTAAITLLVTTAAWQCNMQAARALAETPQPSKSAWPSKKWWCKASCYGGVGAIVAALKLGLCLSALAGCGGLLGTVVLAGLAVPCALIFAVCLGGVFLGYLEVVKAWKKYMC